MTIGAPGMWTVNTETLNASKQIEWGDHKVQLLTASGAARTISLPTQKPSPYSAAAETAGYVRPNDQDYGRLVIANRGATNNVNVASSGMVDNATISITPGSEVELQWLAEVGKWVQIGG